MGKLIAHTKLRKVGRQVMNQVGPHVFITDEPLSLHGTDAGPSPVQYLLSTLGSCLAISAKSIAEHDPDLELSLFNVDVMGETTTFADKSSKLTQVTMRIICQTNLDPDSQAEFIDHALHICTVHNTIKAAVPITIEILS